jgi:hypothetical protein
MISRIESINNALSLRSGMVEIENVISDKMMSTWMVISNTRPAPLEVSCTSS